jgi:hypothetical protein
VPPCAAEMFTRAVPGAGNEYQTLTAAIFPTLDSICRDSSLVGSTACDAVPCSADVQCIEAGSMASSNAEVLDSAIPWSNKERSARVPEKGTGVQSIRSGMIECLDTIFER